MSNSQNQADQIRRVAMQSCLIGLLLAVSFSVSAERKIAEPLRVTMSSPATIENSFWGPLIRFAQAVAEDLNIALKVEYSTLNSLEIRKDGLSILTSKSPPHYFVTGYWYQAAVDYIPTAQEHGVKIFIINRGLPDSDRLYFGDPRQKYSNWIGISIPDEFFVGYRLAEILIAEARKRELTDEKGVVHINGLAAGTEEVRLRLDVERVRALKLSVDAIEHARLGGVYYTYWSREIAKAATPVLLNRYPKTKAIWAETDTMALGAMEAVKEMNIEPGKDVLFGGIDWSIEALQAVKDGRMVATMGGHFIEAGVALILIHDYHYGIDFEGDTGVKIDIPMYPITRENVDEYLPLLTDQNWRDIDFRKFSKKYNKKLKKYDFTPDNLFADLLKKKPENNVMDDK